MILRPAQRKALRSLPKSWLHPAHMPDVYVEILQLGWAAVVPDKKHRLGLTDEGRRILVACKEPTEEPTQDCPSGRATHEL